MTDYFDKKNLTTIAVWIYMLISPILVKYGIEIDQTAFVGVAVPLFGLILAIWSSRNPNDMEILGNQGPAISDDIEEDDYEDGFDDNGV